MKRRFVLPLVFGLVAMGLAALAAPASATRHSAGTIKVTRVHAIPASQVTPAVGSLLDQKDIADLAIEDLRKWSCWDVADQVTQAVLDSGLLYPPQSNILQTEVAVAVKVAETLFARGRWSEARSAILRRSAKTGFSRK